MVDAGGRALNGLGVLPDYQTQSNSECRSSSVGDRLRGISFVAKRERAQTIS